MVKIEFHFDFGAPNSYLAWRVFPTITAETGIEFDYRPMLLGGVFKATNNQPPMMALKDVPSKLAYQEAETRRFCAIHGITDYRFNPHFPVNTLTIMRGAIYAQRQPWFSDYVSAMYAAMWEQGLKMDDPAVVAEVLNAAGLPADELLAATQDPAIKQGLVTNTEATVARGTFGAPTFFVGDEQFFGKDKLRDAVEWAQRGA
ncbi:MAG: 2-hydroxychromene-2-carboxylate isomerase [Pseudomonadota bacterium]